ncbi:hypothetical protein [Clostridium thailandense]|uniref:hypothetical protein n=1 Tax=Clostridium thailandense TaxID=2794346 RepID=UPI0039898892
MDTLYKEKIEFKASEDLEKYKEAIKNIEKASFQHVRHLAIYFRSYLFLSML